MSRDKQIEEMAKIVCNACEMGGDFDGECAVGNDYKKCGITVETATALYNAGYRKSSEVAREIFEEIEKKVKASLTDYLEALNKEHIKDTLLYGRCSGIVFALRNAEYFLAELKKKYTESEDAE